MKRIFIIVAICTVMQFSQCLPSPDDLNTVADIDPIIFPSTTSEMPIINKEPFKPMVYSMRVSTDIRYRYATTVVSSRIINPANYSQDIVFSIVVPETAFISELLMEIDGKLYKANVKEKKIAKLEYNKAVQSGITAAHVAVSTRDSNRFNVNVNVEALSNATFNLTYEELLTRRLEVYNLVINLHLQQIICDLSVDVNIIENSEINMLRIPTLRSGNEIDADENTESNPFAKIEFKNENKTEAHISFIPSANQQKQLMKINEKKNNGTENRDGLYGQFVVQYDVEREIKGGEVMISDDYFIHFFAPDDLIPLSKYVVFVLDVSESMTGRKLIQLREAMTAILADLKEDDYFNIIEFNSAAMVWNLDDPMKNIKYKSVTEWGRELVKESAEPIEVLPYAITMDNINAANIIIKNLVADGGTNIYDALKLALNVSKSGMDSLLANNTEKTALPEPMIIFLTDGEPTVAETDTKKIISMVSKHNFGIKKTAIFTLAFGEDADRGFLKQLATRNSGLMRHIYEAADASAQLKHFYKQISSPLLTDVKFKYPADQIEEASVTEHGFPILFSGAELVVAGKIISMELDIRPEVTGNSIRGPIDFIPKIITVSHPEKDIKHTFERLWAYLTIKQLLDEKDIYIDPELGPVLSSKIENSDIIKEIRERKALELAMKYSFVTSLTSFVVVQINEESTIDTEATKEQFAIAMSPQQVQRHHISTMRHRARGRGRTRSQRPLPTDETGKTVDLAKYSLEQLTWLQDYTVRPDSIQILNGVYKLGVLKNITEFVSCKLPENKNGTCIFLPSCTRVFSHLNSLDSYIPMFCDILGYAGICCFDENLK